MREVGVLELKTHISAVLEELERSGEAITITRHGRPIAQLSALPAREMTSHQAALGLLALREEIERTNGVDQDFDWKAAVEWGRE